MSRSILENEVNKIAIRDADDYFSEQCVFKNRTDAAKRLANKLKLLIRRFAIDVAVVFLVIH